MEIPFSHRLGTNYVPVDGEVQEIRSVVQNNLRAAKAIDETIAALAKQRDAHIDSAARYSALLEPIRRIPDDILALIFCAYLADAGVIPITRTHPAVIASHVCQRWRQLAISTPSLWAGIHLLLPHYPTRYSPSGAWLPPGILSDLVARWEAITDRLLIAAQVSVARSCQHPLSVTLSAPTFNETAELPRIYPRVVKWFALLCRESHRWKQAQFDTYFTDTPENVARALEPFLSLKAKDLPLLESLRLPEFVCPDPYTPSGPNKFVLHSGLEIFRAPGLKTLQLEGICHKWDTLPVRWSTLTALRLSSYRGHLLHTQTHISRIGPLEALSLLQECRNLISCDLTIESHDLDEIGPSYHDFSTKTVHLPHLQFLTIRNDVPGVKFVRALDVPSLRSLQLTSSFAYMDGIAPWASASTLERPGLPWLQILGDRLHTVALNLHYLSPAALRLLLQSLPVLLDLRLKYSIGASPDNPCDAGLVIDYLTVSARDTDRPQGTDDAQLHPTLCPNLRQFQLDVRERPGSVTEEGVLKFIASRRNTLGCASESHDGREVANLEEATILFGSLQKMNILEELKKRSVDIIGLRLDFSYPSPEPVTPHRFNFLSV